MGPVKTLEGQAELLTRRLRLSQRHRTVLLLVDGRRSEDEVRGLALQAGAAAECFDELVALGLLERPSASLPAEDPGPARRAAGHLRAGRGPALQALLPGDEEELAPSSLDSLLPAAATLPPDSTAIQSVLDGAPPADAWLPDDEDDLAAATDDALEQAREILLRVVRMEAPWAGSLTLLRLKRARSRPDLEALLEEVEAHVHRPHRGLAAAQTITSVRQLLATPSAPVPLAK